jgi:DNA-binding transcriptional regulator YhcF (GntR family)
MDYERYIPKDYEFASKWGEVTAQHGFTQVPNLLLGCQGHLGLTDGEVITLVNLASFWFSKNGNIYPSIKTLTKFSGKSYTTIQKRLRTLEEKGFIKRVQRMNTSSKYELGPCIEKLTEHKKSCKSPPRKQYLDHRKMMDIPLSKLRN